MTSLEKFHFEKLWIISICMHKMLCQLFRNKHFYKSNTFQTIEIGTAKKIVGKKLVH